MLDIENDSTIKLLITLAKSYQKIILHNHTNDHLQKSKQLLLKYFKALSYMAQKYIVCT